MLEASYWKLTESSQFPVSSFQFPVSSFQFPASSFQLPVSSFQLPASSYCLINVITPGSRLNIHTPNGSPMILTHNSHASNDQIRLNQKPINKK